MDTADPSRDDLQHMVVGIKKDLRAYMNGVASAHMRRSEDYRVNWGVEMPRLATMAAETGRNRALAQMLWNESVRECKILACMVMPVEEFPEELCDLWAESIRTEEIATVFCLHLAQHLPYAGAKAFEWMADERTMLQVCGFAIMCHLMRRRELSENAVEEFLDQAAASTGNRYAMKALQIFASLSDENARKVKKITDCL